jgi:hypothetical protein
MAWTHIGQGPDVVDNVSRSGHEGGMALTQIDPEARPTRSSPSIVAVARITSVAYAPECCQTVDGCDPSPPAIGIHVARLSAPHYRLVAKPCKRSYPLDR